MKVKLSDISYIFQGRNQKRLRRKYNNNIRLYDATNFSIDKNLSSTIIYSGCQDKEKLSRGDIIISSTMNKAALVSDYSDGFIYDNNYIKIVLDIDKIYPLYFIYIINEDYLLKKQIATSIQGTHYKKMTVTTLNNLIINLPDTHLQKKIGDSYKMIKNISFNLMKKEKLLSRYTNTYIAKIIKENINEEK